MKQACEGPFSLPRYAELPTMGLYLEQVTAYLNTQLAPLEDVRLTSAIVSNYVKHHLITGPVKKLYGRDQLADLIFIAVAKNILPLGDIRVAVRVQQNSRGDRASAHDGFCEELEAAVEAAGNDQPLFVPVTRTPAQQMLHDLALAAAYKANVDRFFAVTREAGD